MFLARRVTNELYFDLVSKGDAFSKSWGPAVQSLVGEVARRSDKRGRFAVIPERSYGSSKRRRDTIDWIILDDGAALFVECKGARTRFRGISDLTSQEFIDGEFSRIRDFAVQTYKTLHDCLAGEYPNWKPDGRPIYPLIVTLEDWQTFGMHVDRLVVAPLKAEMERLGIDPKIVEKHPLSFCAVDTFEQAMAVCNDAGIDAVFRQKTAGEYPQWALETFLLQNFKDELSRVGGSIFEEEWAKLMPEGHRGRRPPSRRRRAS
jgi:hypothetical protein